MSKNKNGKIEDERLEVDLNGELLDQFTDELEVAINKVCEDNATVDPRLELLVTLGLLSAQVSQDSGYPKEEFLNLMSDLFDDIENAVDEDEEDEDTEEFDFPVVTKKKGNQFDIN